MSGKVENILANYNHENLGVRSKLYQMLMHGKLKGTGKMVILPVDQGFEHGPIKSFTKNPSGFDPEYHIKLAIDAGLNGFAAPVGMLEAAVDKYYGQIPLILKVNNANSLNPGEFEPEQALTSSVEDALRLGCSAIGFTIYPGSGSFNHMVEELKEVIREAKACGLAVIIWSYPRGGDLEKSDETACDVISYAAHIACLLGANIVKVKLPTEDIYKDKIDSSSLETLSKRVNLITKSCFANKRMVIFSGGASKDTASLLTEIEAIKEGGGNGSIIGRNAFQRPYNEALELLGKIVEIYKG